MNKLYSRSAQVSRMLMVLMLAIFVASCGDTKTAASADADTSAATEEATQQEDATAQSSGSAMSLTEKDIEALKAKFTFDEATGYYYHNHWNRNFPTRRTLTADVNKTGYFYLCSNFYGNKGINHSKIEVQIGEGEKMASDAINRRETSEHVVQKTADGKVFEVNYYTKYRDKGIFEAIGKSEGEKVQVRFIGTESYTQFEELKALDVDALKECYMLSLVLRATGGA